jgi:hypothetical protein
MKQFTGSTHQSAVMDYQTAAPDFETIRQDALMAGGIDVMSMRFRVIEYEKATGEMVGVAIQNAGFRDAVEKTQKLIIKRADSHFCLEPVGFLQ